MDQSGPLFNFNQDSVIQHDFVDNHQKPCDTVKLSFVLLKAEAKIRENNEIRVNLLIDNNSDFDWPKNLHLKGKPDCKLSSQLDYIIVNSIKRSSLKGIKCSFVFSGKKETERLILQFSAIDESKRVKYYSDDVVVDLKAEKNEKKLLRYCGFIA